LLVGLGHLRRQRRPAAQGQPQEEAGDPGQPARKERSSRHRQKITAK
jgi:hypothetical protein